MTPWQTVSLWAQHLGQVDYAAATVKRYCGSVRQFLTWYEKQERRPVELVDLTPIAMMGYRQAMQQNQTTATTNIHVAALRAWGSWLSILCRACLPAGRLYEGRIRNLYRTCNVQVLSRLPAGRRAHKKNLSMCSIPYSYLNASIGLLSDACLAG